MSMRFGPVSSKMCLVCIKGWDGIYDDFRELGFSHQKSVGFVRLAKGTPPCDHVADPNNRSDRRIFTTR
jgi:hypothetical protein